MRELRRPHVPKIDRVVNLYSSQEEFSMLECAIPKCCAREKLLRSGTLHLADVVLADGSVAKKMIWLCAGCTSLYSVQTWRAAGEQIRPRSPSPFSLADIFSVPMPPFEPKPVKEISLPLALAAFSSELQSAVR